MLSAADNFPLVPGLGTSPYNSQNIRFNPADGFVYAYASQSFSSSGFISQIDPKQARIVNRLTVPPFGTVVDVQLAPAGDYLYTLESNYPDFSIYRYRLADRQREGPYRVNSTTAKIAISPGDSRLYAISEGFTGFPNSQTVTLYRDGVQVGTSASVSGFPVDRRLYFASAGRLLHIVETGIQEITVSDSGLTWNQITTPFTGLTTSCCILTNNRLFSGRGQVLDLNGFIPLAKLPVIGDRSSTTPFAISSDASSSYYLIDQKTLGVYSNTDFKLTGTVAFTKNIASISAAGQDALAVSNEDGVYIVPLSAVTPTPTDRPAPTSISSNGAQELALAVNSMAWDPSRNLLYLTTPTAAGYLGNSLVVVDPATATIQNSAYVGSEPQSISFAESGNTMHIALEGPRSVVTLNPQSLATTQTTPLVDSTSSFRVPASSVTAVPGSDTAFLAIRTRDNFLNTPFFGTVAYDRGSPLPSALSDTSSSFISPGQTPGLFYQWSGSSSSRQLLVDANGIAIGRSSFNSFNGGLAATEGDDAFTLQGEVYQFGQSSSAGRIRANGYTLSGANSPSFGFSSDGQTIYSLAIRPGCTFGSYVPCDVYPDGVRSQLISITATDRRSLAVVGQYSFTVPNTRLNVTGTFDVLPTVQLSVTDNEIFLNFRSWLTRIPLSAFAPAPMSSCEVNSFSMNPNPLFVSQSPFTPSFTLGGSVSCSYEIRIGSASGRLVAFGEPGQINRNVSTPVSDGDLFYLQRTGNTTDAGTLATLKARVRTTSGSACTASGFSLLPGPIFPTTPLDSLFFSGSVTCPYEIRSGTPSGPVVASGIDGFISARPNAPLSNGLVFYLQQSGITTPVGTMASITVQVSDPVSLPCSASTLSVAPVLSTGATSRLLFTGTAECSFDIRAGSPTGRIVGSGSPGSVQLSVNAEVSDGDKFFLQRSGSGSALGTMAVATARVRDSFIAACNVSQFGINPSPIYTTGQFGTGTLSGDVSCSYDVRVNSPDGSLFTWGNAGQFSWQTGNWVSNDMVFYLQARGNQTAAGTLATAIAKVKNGASSCTVTNFGANPNPIRTNGVFGSATITGTVTCPYDIRIGNANGPIFAGGQSGAISATTGAWITDGMSFYLQPRGDASDAGTLAVFTAKLQPAGATSCSVHGLAANPNPIRTTGTLGSTTLVGTSDCAYEVRMGKPDGPLFAAGQRGNISAPTGAWVNDGMTFYVQAQNDVTPQGTLGVVTARVFSTSTAAPCNASGFGMIDSPVRTNDLFGATTLTGRSDCSYDIRVGSPDGNLFASGFGGTINAGTGRWVSEGMTFYLQPSGSTDPNATLAITQATLQQAASACVVGGFFADPVSGNQQFGSTTLMGRVDCDYDIRVGAPDGTLFASGQRGAISASTGAWVSDGMVFYLQTRNDTTSAGTLATARASRGR